MKVYAPTITMEHGLPFYNAPEGDTPRMVVTADIAKKIQTSYSGDRISEGKVRKPIEYDGTLWVATSGNGNLSGAMRMIPEEDYQDPYAGIEGEIRYTYEGNKVNYKKKPYRLTDRHTFGTQEEFDTRDASDKKREARWAEETAEEVKEVRALLEGLEDWTEAYPNRNDEYTRRYQQLIQEHNLWDLTDLKDASAEQLQALAQIFRPTEWGVNRLGDERDEIARRKESYFKELGIPFDMDSEWRNLHTGSVEPLKNLFTEKYGMPGSADVYSWDNFGMNAANWEPNVGPNLPLVNSLEGQIETIEATLGAIAKYGNKLPKTGKGFKGQVVLHDGNETTALMFGDHLAVAKAPTGSGHMLVHRPTALSLADGTQGDLKVLVAMLEDSGIDLSQGEEGKRDSIPKDTMKALTTVRDSWLQLIEKGRDLRKEKPKLLNKELGELKVQLKKAKGDIDAETKAVPKPSAPKQRPAGPGDNAPGSEPTDAGATGGTSPERIEPNGVRPPLRVVKEALLPRPPEAIAPDQYTQFDAQQRLATNLAINAFEEGRKGFMLADGTGVGKTFQELAIAKEWYKRSGKPSLIITENQQIIDNNFKRDAEKLGIDLKGVELGTYHSLRAGNSGKGKYGVVVFDEAHNLKNAGAAKTEAADKVTTDHKVFATATPMDRPTGAAYFISELTGIPHIEVMQQLGMKLISVPAFPGARNKFKEVLVPQHNMNWSKVYDNIIKMRDQSIAAGQMVRREYPFFGTIKATAKSLPPNLVAEESRIDDYWDMRMAQAKTPKARRNVAGQRTLEHGRWLEGRKIDWAYDEVRNALDRGRKVILVAEGVNSTLVKGLDETLPGMIKAIATRLKADGTAFAEIYGTGNKSQAVADFQSGKVQMAIMTPKSGGAGIDLDDASGDNPRTMLIATPNFAGDVFQQILGRVSRRNTASPAEVKFLLYSDSFSDHKRLQIAQEKIATLTAIQSGEDLDVARGLLVDGEVVTRRAQPAAPTETTETKLQAGKKKAARRPAKPKDPNYTTLSGAINYMGGISFKGFEGEQKSWPWQVRAKIVRKNGTPWDIAIPSLIDQGYVAADEDLMETLRTEGLARLAKGVIGAEPKTAAQEQAKEDLGPEIFEPEEPPPGEYEIVKAKDLPEGKALTIIGGNSIYGWDVYKVVEKDPFGVTLQDGERIELAPDEEVQVLVEGTSSQEPVEDINFQEPIDDKGSYVDWSKPKQVEKDGLTQEYFATYDSKDAFKKWMTPAEIERLQANIGEDILILGQEDYGRQPKAKGAAIGRSKQMGLGLEDPNSKQQTMFALGKGSIDISEASRDNRIEAIKKILEGESHDYIETDTVRRVRGADGSVYQRSARSEAAEQIADLYADQFRSRQTIVTIAQTQEWLSQHTFPKIAKSGMAIKNIARLLKNKAAQSLSIFDRIRLAAQLERPMRKKDYLPFLAPSGNAKTTGGTNNIREQNAKTEGSNILAADTIAGCDHFCYECYALKATARAQGGGINHQHPVFVKLRGLLHTGELLRIGEKGDPSKDWAWTHEQVADLLKRSQKAGHKVDADSVFYITKLLNLDGINTETARNIQVTLDPMYPDHMWRSMQNIMRLKAAAPEVNLSVRVRTFHTSNQDLNDAMRAAARFANDFNLPLNETRMRFIRDLSFDLLELDRSKYYYHKKTNQFKTKHTVLAKEAKNHMVCDSADIGCPGCKNCNRLTNDRKKWIPLQNKIIGDLGLTGMTLPQTHEFDPVGWDATGNRPKYALGKKQETFSPKRALKQKMTSSELRNLQQLFDMIDQSFRDAGLSQAQVERVAVELKPILDLRGKNVEKTLKDWADTGKNVSTILGATTFAASVPRWN